MTNNRQVFELIRLVSPQECHWLDKVYDVGDIVFKYHGHTFGCISKKGAAFCEVFDQEPFFELPINAVVKI